MLILSFMFSCMLGATNPGLPHDETPSDTAHEYPKTLF